MRTEIQNEGNIGHFGLYPPEWDDLDFDEMEFFREAQEKAHARGFAIVFMGRRLHSCDLIVLHDFATQLRHGTNQGPFRKIVHAVEFTGDYVTDLTYLWKSFENMGQLGSRFAQLNTPTRWDCRKIGEA